MGAFCRSHARAQAKHRPCPQDQIASGWFVDVKYMALKQLEVFVTYQGWSNIASSLWQWQAVSLRLPEYRSSHDKVTFHRKLSFAEPSLEIF